MSSLQQFDCTQSLRSDFSPLQDMFGVGRLHIHVVAGPAANAHAHDGPRVREMHPELWWQLSTGPTWLTVWPTLQQRGSITARSSASLHAVVEDSSRFSLAANPSNRTVCLRGGGGSSLNLMHCGIAFNPNPERPSVSHHTRLIIGGSGRFIPRRMFLQDADKMAA